MSIDTIRTSLNALENLARNLGLDMQDISQRREDAAGETAPAGEQKSDTVNFTSHTLRRLHTNLSNEEPISQEEARATLQEVRNAASSQLLQAHGGLDPQRVFALLASDD